MTTDLITTNRLAKSGGKTPGKSVFSALEWAAMAHAKRLTKVAEAWEQAARDGWDADHYDPVAASEYRHKIELAQASW